MDKQKSNKYSKMCRECKGKNRKKTWFQRLYGENKHSSKTYNEKNQA